MALLALAQAAGTVVAPQSTVFIPDQPMSWVNMISQVGFPIFVSGALLYIMFTHLSEIRLTLREICTYLEISRKKADK